MDERIYYYGSDGHIKQLGDQNYLEHHGVPGMRWGFRKRPERALNKLYKYDKKANRALIESGKLQAKSARKQLKANKMKAKAMKNTGTSKEKRYERKAKALERQSNKLLAKAGKKMSGGVIYDRTHRGGSFSSNTAKAQKLAANINKRDGALSNTELKRLKAKHLYVGRKYAVNYLG